MPPDTYLIVIKDDELAHSVAAALDYQLAKDGQAVTVVPAFRQLDFASWRPGLATSAGQRPGPAGRCLAVGICEPGLLQGLKSLGLAAYVGIPGDEQPRIIRWSQHAGAQLIPITTAADLIDAIAASTAWPPPAPAPAPPRPRAVRLRLSRPQALRPAALSRKLVIASAAAGATGTILLATATTATTAPAASPARTGHPTTATLAAYTSYSPLTQPTPMSTAQYATTPVYGSSYPFPTGPSLFSGPGPSVNFPP